MHERNKNTEFLKSRLVQQLQRLFDNIQLLAHGNTFRKKKKRVMCINKACLMPNPIDISRDQWTKYVIYFRRSMRTSVSDRKKAMLIFSVRIIKKIGGERK